MYFKGDLNPPLLKSSVCRYTQALFKGVHDFGKDFDYWQSSSDLVARKIKIMPYYVCWEVSNFTGIFWIGTNSAISVYLVDPNRYTSHRILNEALHGDEIFQELEVVFFVKEKFK